MRLKQAMPSEAGSEAAICCIRSIASATVVTAGIEAGTGALSDMARQSSNSRPRPHPAS